MNNIFELQRILAWLGLLASSAFILGVAIQGHPAL